MVEGGHKSKTVGYVKFTLHFYKFDLTFGATLDILPDVVLLDRWESSLILSESGNQFLILWVMTRTFMPRNKVVSSHFLESNLMLDGPKTRYF